MSLNTLHLAWDLAKFSGGQCHETPCTLREMDFAACWLFIATSCLIQTYVLYENNKNWDISTNRNSIQLGHLDVVRVKLYSSLQQGALEGLAGLVLHGVVLPGALEEVVAGLQRLLTEPAQRLLVPVHPGLHVLRAGLPPENLIYPCFPIFNFVFCIFGPLFMLFWIFWTI